MCPFNGKNEYNNYQNSFERSCVSEAYHISIKLHWFFPAFEIKKKLASAFFIFSLSGVPILEAVAQQNHEFKVSHIAAAFFAMIYYQNH